MKTCDVCGSEEIVFKDNRDLNPDYLLNDDIDMCQEHYNEYYTEI